MKLIPLSPKMYEFSVDEKLNKIEYFFLEGANEIPENHKLIEKLVAQEALNIDNYNAFSIYIYKKTDRFNKEYKGDNESFDGYNRDILAYIRYTKGKQDTFYFLENGKVIYDNFKKEKVNFEFDE
ncbi:hypothetical protein NAL32_13665 [Chryseobacterium sp. Ch-15]|uniref:Uncharacterized protein n=1 Tax=Chryseobacterium muglaense TaxID=2893752 RepID=A0A9Q3UVL3_9FLAO|nr:hypothetical protein [Chryseobacterium muglaense]MBD3905418.1 hypothetical protein [Chryseobacterium muglaense]MCC9036508.1 hypothetical protein [Chryseobacterium muglaense]MCM2555433.1 hypothetical protein [Chryseobacterium muglaense]